jgi:hypothetical protein
MRSPARPRRSLQPRGARLVPPAMLAALPWALSGAHALSSTPAQAEPATVQPIVVEYDAESRCPPAQFFVDQIRARFQRIREAEGDEPSLRLVVSARIAGDAALGRLEVHSLDGSVNARVMRARRCEDLVAALALVAALSIARDASLELVVPRPPAAARVPDTPIPEDPGPPSTNTPAPTPALERSATFVPPSAHARQPRSRVTWSIGAGGSMLGHVLPAIAWGGRTWVQAGTGDVGPWSLTGRLSFGAAALFPSALGAGEARFQLLTVRLDGCPIAVRWKTLGFEPCLSVEGGGLFGQGVDIQIPKSASAPWLTVGPLGRLSLNVGSRVSVELESGVVAPLSWPVMTFQEAVAYEVRGVGFAAGLGATMPIL